MSIQWMALTKLNKIKPDQLVNPRTWNSDAATSLLLIAA
jgi:hypothetical protein